MASARKLEQDLNTMTETLHSLVRSFQVIEERDESNKQVNYQDHLIFSSYRTAVPVKSNYVVIRVDGPTRSSLHASPGGLSLSQS